MEAVENERKSMPLKKIALVNITRGPAAPVATMSTTCLHSRPVIFKWARTSLTFRVLSYEISYGYSGQSAAHQVR